MLAQGGVDLRAWKKERNEEIVKYLFFYFLRAVYRCPSKSINPAQALEIIAAGGLWVVL